MGGFAHSHGLERAMAAGDVRDVPTCEAWVAGVLDAGSGRADAVLLAHALAEGADLDALHELALALAASRERAAETLALGSAFAHAVTALTGEAHVPRAMPVAVGAAAAPLGLPVTTVLALYLQAFAGGIVAAAVRFVPLGGVAGQGVLARLAPLIAGIAGEAAATPLDGIASGAFRSDLAAMHHETQAPRLFLT